MLSTQLRHKIMGGRGNASMGPWTAMSSTLLIFAVLQISQISGSSQNVLSTYNFC